MNSQLIFCTTRYQGHHISKDEKSGGRGTFGRDEKFIQNFSQKPQGLRPRERHRSRRQDNINMHVKETFVTM
jgi:hypothetical protein